MKKANICGSYVGLTCVNGYCPMIQDEESELGCNIIKSCNECSFYKGCEDCALNATDICEKH